MTDVDDLRAVLDDIAAAHSRPLDGGAPRAPGELWDELESLGLTLVGADEGRGGGGGTVEHAIEVAAAVGRHALPLPIAETAVVASWLLDSAGLDLPPGPLTAAGFARADRVTAIPTGAGGVHLRGVVRAVPWAREAAHVALVADGPDGCLVGLVEPADLVLAEGENLAGEPRDDAELDLDAPVWAPLPGSVTGAGIRARAALSRSVQILGALERTRDITMEFVQQREQFGRPIIRFQAVAQSVAVLAAEVALTRAAVTRCLRSGASNGPVWEFACGAAKVTASGAAATVAAIAHQVHGAVGITAEYPLHRLTSRLLSWQDDDGTEDEWAAVLGRSLPELGPDPWAALTAGEVLG
ncbi:acyl-CoA dehydrogenase family protein [Pseudonocardia xishanensis]|uniref:Acyl-CoA dehydrogenase family protein n=1 Tax=Pseudonocardia xishanensis TaxID=630995 RepID=A0ABP8RH37_9PSEU